jgi:hypothetical protein
MKKLLSITCVLLLAMGIAAAQDTPSGEQPAPQEQEQALPQSDQTADQITIRGCLSGSDQNFTISDQSGRSYKLSGDFAMLSEHVGHEVELTGKFGEVAAGEQPAGEQAAATGDQKLFEFSNVKMISETCSTGGEARPESDTAAIQPESETTTAQPDASAAQTQPDMSAQQAAPSATADPNVTAQQPEVPAQEETAQQPEAPVAPEDQPATEQQPAQEQTEDQAVADEQLPQTATPLPLLALLGFGALAAGLWSRRK